MNEKKDKRLCLNYGKHWPHQEGAGNCRTFGKRCTRCGKRNHFQQFCKSKHEIKATKELAYRGEDISDTTSESSEESTCTLETLNLMGSPDRTTDH